MTAVEELAYRIQTGNIDPTRGAAILERAFVTEGLPEATSVAKR